MCSGRLPHRHHPLHLCTTWLQQLLLLIHEWILCPVTFSAAAHTFRHVLIIEHPDGIKRRMVKGDHPLSVVRRLCLLVLVQP